MTIDAQLCAALDYRWRRANRCRLLVSGRSSLPIPASRVDHLSRCGRVGIQRCSHSVRHGVGRGPHHVGRPLDIAPGHRQGAMVEKIADGERMGASECGEGACGVAQIMQSSVGDAGELAQSLPSLFRGADWQRLSRVEPVHEKVLPFLNGVQDRYGPTPEMHCTRAGLGIAESDRAPRRSASVRRLFARLYLGTRRIFQASLTDPDGAPWRRPSRCRCRIMAWACSSCCRIAPPERVLMR